MSSDRSTQAFEQLIREAAEKATLPFPDEVIERKIYQLADKLSNRQEDAKQIKLSGQPDNLNFDLQV
jgi:hypothetical protein